jgi:hypothetical protein
MKYIGEAVINMHPTSSHPMPDLNMVSAIDGVHVGGMTGVASVLECLGMDIYHIISGTKIKITVEVEE